MAAYPHLMSKGHIGAMELRNRIAVTAMGVSMAEEDGHCGEQIIRYHEEQAAGGVGLIITGVAGVAWPVGGNQLRQIAISDDRFLPGLKKLTEAVHSHGGKIAAQIHHGGLVGGTDILEGRPLWAPSYPDAPKWNYMEIFLPEELEAAAKYPSNVSLKVMDEADIKLVVSQFAAGADRAKRAGFDGAEIHAGHGYLIGSFLSPRFNKRTDDYGGSRENRARFLLEILGAVRAAVGRDFPIWVKLDSREVGKPDGIQIEDAIWNAQQTEAAGADAITVTAYHDTDRPELHSGSHTPQQPGLNIPFAAQIKKAVNIPIIASGRIEVDVADKAIADGAMDFVSMGRKLLADPHLPRKLAEGKPEDVLPCIYCYTCISQIYFNGTTRCAVNAETGFEYLRKPKAPAPVGASNRRIVVVGGGPGGMEAARRLDALGHRVTLLEKGDRLGGTLRFASLAYEPNEHLLHWLERQIKGSNVDVRLNTEATPDLLRTLDPDVVFVATGAVRGMPPIPGADASYVFSGDDLRQLVLGESSDSLKKKTGLLTRVAAKVGAATGISGNLDLVRKATQQWMPLGQRIGIIGGELVGLELAEFLMERGRQVFVVDEQERLGRGLTVVRRMRLMTELREHGVAIFAGASDIRIAHNSVHFKDANGAQMDLPADHVVIAKGAHGDLSLAEKLSAEGFTVHALGDATGVGYIEGAMRGAAHAVAKVA